MKDWIGLWFKIQAERGHSDEVPILLIQLREKRIENHSFLHRQMDGVAALSSLLRAKCLEPRRATGRVMARPAWYSVPRLIARGLAGNSESGRPPWKVFRAERTEKSKQFQFLHLDESANGALVRKLRESRVSLSAYLLSCLSQAMEELFIGPASGSWLLPVDMRPAFPNRELSGNCVSYIRVRTETDALAIHQQIKSALEDSEHWSNWWVYHIGKVVGYRGMQRLSRRSSERTFWLGSFTDLGDWTPAQGSGAQDYGNSVWAITAPGTPNNPVSCASIAWFGQRSISLRIHPAISENSPDSVRAILRRVAQVLERDMGVKAELIETEL